jgi:hypothetical protein
VHQIASEKVKLTVTFDKGGRQNASVKLFLHASVIFFW